MIVDLFPIASDTWKSNNAQQLLYFHISASDTLCDYLSYPDSPVLPLPILGPKGGQELQHVALISDDHRANFFLKSVQNKDGSEIGVMNSQEWRHSLYPDNFQEDKRKYLVTVGFTAKKHSTYHQDLVFGFLNWPVYLQRLCADYLHTKDYERIQRATNYQQSQIPLRWKEPYEFYSPFMPHANPREIKLSRIYPYPDRQSFVLTQNTLSDNRLTPRNYRGRMHEMITLEEIARHEQLSRYNQISWLRLMAHYVLFNSDASTIAKYTPPGELFAQVRFFLAFRRLLPLYSLFIALAYDRIFAHSYCMVCPNFLANVYIFIHFYTLIHFAYIFTYWFNYIHSSFKIEQ